MSRLNPALGDAAVCATLSPFPAPSLLVALCVLTPRLPYLGAHPGAHPGAYLKTSRPFFLSTYISTCFASSAHPHGQHLDGIGRHCAKYGHQI